MSEFGVLCKLADGEDFVVTLTADSADDALAQVRSHQRLFYGGGDAAGRWLASKNKRTIVEVGEVRPLADWPLDE